MLRKADLMAMVGRRVKVTFFSGIVLEGILGYTPEFAAKYGWRKPDYFTIGKWDFKVSHAKNAKLMEYPKAQAKV